VVFYFKKFGSFRETLRCAFVERCTVLEALEIGPGLANGSLVALFVRAIWLVSAVVAAKVRKVIPDPFQGR